MLRKKLVDVFSVYKTGEDCGLLFVEKPQPEISYSYSVGSSVALELFCIWNFGESAGTFDRFDYPLQRGLDGLDRQFVYVF